MCGLVAVVVPGKAGFTQPEIDAASTLLWVTQLRGYDSTGVVGIGHDNDTWWCKEIGTPQKMFGSKNWEQWKKSLFDKGKLMFGHCRAATRGAATIANAHPFQVDKADPKNTIIGIHNGTLDIWQHLDKDFDKYEVDSEWLITCLAKYGAKKTLEQFKGAAALIWYDTELKTINFYRNHERPLFYVKTPQKYLIVNSEEANLKWICARHKINVKDEDIKTFEPNVWYQLGLHDADWKEERITKDYNYGNQHGYNSRRYLPPTVTTEAKPRETDIFNLERNFEADQRHLFNGTFTAVWWDERGRHTSMPKGSRWMTPNSKPYEMYLQQMSMTAHGTLRMEFETGGTRWSQEVARPPGAVVSTVVPMVLEPVKGKWCVDGLELERGKVLNFETIYNHGNIKHNIMCGKKNPRLLDRYENNHDGVTQIDDEVTIEVADIEMIKEGAFRCRGYRLKEKMDAATEFVFVTTRHTEKQITKTPYFTGKVANIKLTTRERFLESGSVVEAFIVDTQQTKMEQVHA